MQILITTSSGEGIRTDIIEYGNYSQAMALIKQINSDGYVMHGVYQKATPLFVLQDEDRKPLDLNKSKPTHPYFI